MGIAFTRLAGQPWDSTTSLRASRTLRALGEQRAIETRLTASLERLDAALYDAIRAAVDRDRDLLIALRRKVRHSRRGSGEALPALVARTAALPSTEEAAACVLGLLVDREASVLRVESAFHVDREHADNDLKVTLADEGMRRAILLTSGELSRAVDAWLAGGPRPRSQTRSKLTRLVARATAKTSPFSSFMLLAELPERAGAHDVEVNCAPHRWESILEPAVGSLSSPPTGNTSTSRVSATTVFRDGRIYYVDTVAGDWRVLTRTLSAETLELLETSAGTGITMADLPGDATDLERSGVIEAVPPVEVDPTRRTWWGPISSHPFPAPRDASHGALAEQMDRWRDVTDARSAANVRDNVVLREPPIVRSRAWSDTVAARLRGVAGVLAVLDPLDPWRAAAAAFFREELGRTASCNLLEFDLALAASGARGDRWGRLFTVLRDPAHRVLSPAWDEMPFGRDFNARMRDWGRLVVDSARGQRRVVLGSDTVLDALGAEPPTDVASLTVYFQLADSAHPMSVVLNDVQTGYGRGVERAAWVLGVGDGSRIGSSDEQVVELSNLFHNNLAIRCLRGPSLDFPSSGPRLVGQLIDPRSLVVSLDPTTGRLRLRDQEGRRTRVVNTSSIADDLLPKPLGRMVTLFGGTGHLLHPALSAAAMQSAGTVEGVAHAPRISIDATVVARESWLVATERLETADSALSLRGWTDRRTRAERVGIPTQFYLRALPGNGGAWQAAKMRKPMYVDLDSPYLTHEMRSITENAATVLVTEPLPHRHGSFSFGESHHHVEFLAEVRIR
jgi:hypothetical protein